MKRYLGSSIIGRIVGGILILQLTLGGVIFIAPKEAQAAVPQIISYQGRLTDSSGSLLGGSSGTTYYFKFSIWDNSTVGSGSRLWPSSAPTEVGATVTSGVFNVNIGDTAAGYPDALDYDFDTDPDVFLQIEVSATSGGTFETLSPRQRITSAGFAINAGTLLGFTPSQTASGSNIPVLNSGNLLLAGTNPQINATSTNTITLQGGGGTGDIQFFSSSNKIDSSGNLTIAGTLTAPSLSFTNATGTGNLQVANLTATASTTFGGVAYTWPGTAGTNGYVLSTNGSGVLSWVPDQTGSGAASYWVLAGTTLYTTSSANSVGINTDTPSSSFHVVGSATITGSSTLAGVTFTNATGTGNLQVATLNTTGNATIAGDLDVTATTTLASDLVVDTNTLYVNSNTNRVGIGTSAPSTTLHVVGQLRTSATSTFDGNIVIGGDTIGDFVGTGLSVSSAVLNVSGLTVSEFATTSISQWTNDSGYIATALLSLNGQTGETQTFATTTTSGVFNLSSAGNVHTLTLPSNVGYFTNDAGYLTAALTSLNGLTGATQTFATTTGSAFTITSSGSTHTIQIPNALSFFTNDSGYVTSSGITAINGLTNSTTSIVGTSNQVTVTTSSPNIITLALPQDVHTGASPTFTGLSVTNATATGNIQTATFTATGAATLQSTLNVSGLSTLAGVTFTNATGTGNLQVATLNTTGNATVGAALDVGATSTFDGNIVIGGDTIGDFVGTGLSLSGTTLQTTLGTSVDLSSEITGTLPVGNGGTGATTFTSNGILYGNTTGAVQVTAAGTSAQIFQANGSGVPGFVTVSGDATIAAGGAVTLANSGVTALTYGSTTVVPVITVDAKGRVTSVSSSTIAIAASQITSGVLGVTNGGTGTSTQFTAGSLIFASSSANYTANASNLFWDQTNTRLGIGTSTPASTLHVAGGLRTSGVNTFAGAINASSTLTVTGQTVLANASTTNFEVSGTVTLPAGSIGSNELATDSVGSAEIAADAVGSSEIASSGVAAGTYGSGSVVPVITVDEDGRLTSISSSSVTASGGDPFKWIANGTDLYASTTYTQVAIGTSTPANTLHVVGTFRVSATSTFDSNISIGGDTIGDFVGTGLSLSGTTLQSTLGTAVDLGSEITGTLPVGNGGTGATTFTTNGILYGNTTDAVQVTAAGTSAQILQANGSGVPGFVTLSGDATIAVGGAVTLANSGVTALTYGSTSVVPVFTVDSKGRVTSVSSSTIAIAASQITSGVLGVTNGGTGTSTQFTAGSILFASSSAAYAVNASNFFWDQTNTRLGIGTSTPQNTLHVVGTFRSSATSTIDTDLVVDTNTLYVNSSNNRVGIGTSSPSSSLHVVGDFKVTATSTFSGATTIDDLNLGEITLGPDSGIISLFDMPVTSAAATGTVEAYNIKIDGNSILTVYAESDGSGGTQNRRVAIGAGVNVAPSSTLHVVGNIRSSATTTVDTDLVVDTDTLYVNSNTNRVGIGTSTPAHTLHVVGTLSVSATTTLNGVAYSWPSADGAADQVLTTNGAGVLSWSTATGGSDTKWLQSGTTLYTTSTASSVGINTDTPSTTLHVVGTFRSSATSTIDTDLVVDTNTLYVNSSNNRVGIGTTTASSSLHVVGTFQVSATSTFGGAIVFGGDTLTDFVGSGLTVTSGALTVAFSTTDGSGATSNASGLELGTDGIGLLQGCSNDQILKWNDSSSTWACANDATSTASGGGGATGVSVFFATSTASTTWTKPANAVFVRVIVVGAGGGGGSADSNDTSSNAAGAGGGAGGYAEKWFDADDLNATETIVIGTGGAGGNVADGTDGTLSSFSTSTKYVVGNGGEGGGGVATGNTTSRSPGGPGGTAEGGDVNIEGGRGGDGLAPPNGTGGGYGADSYFGPGAPGATNALANGAGSVNGSNATSTGAGGSGAVSFNDSGAGADGGAGANGGVLVFTYTSDGGADLAETYPTNDPTLGPADVVIIDPTIDAGVQKSTRATDPYVLGVVSTNPGLRLGGDGYEEGGAYVVSVALSGRVPVHVSAENGPIQPGDMLTAASVPGHAMRATKPGIVIGQALSAFDGNTPTGMVLMFVDRGYYGGPSLYDGFDLADLIPTTTASTTLTDTASSTTASSSEAEVVTPEDPLATVESLVTSTVTVVDQIFEGSVVVQGSIFFNEDTIGQAEILEGATSTLITFVTEYATKPIVTLTPENFLGSINYAVTNVSTTGFTIAIDAAQDESVLFNWHSFGAPEGARVFVSDGTRRDITFTVIEIDPADLPEIVIEDPEDNPDAVYAPYQIEFSQPATSTDPVESGSATSTPSSSDTATSSADVIEEPTETVTSTAADAAGGGGGGGPAVSTPPAVPTTSEVPEATEPADAPVDSPADATDSSSQTADVAPTDTGSAPTTSAPSQTSSDTSSSDTTSSGSESSQSSSQSDTSGSSDSGGSTSSDSSSSDSGSAASSDASGASSGSSDSGASNTSS